MASEPTISVVVPVYNAQKFLDECLSSLLGQTFKDIEVICVDDGSTDESGRMVDAAAENDSRVRAVHQQNAGVSAARNKGLELARGSYVLFVDSDDFIRRDTCQILHDVAQRDDADIVVFGGKTFPVSFWADGCFAKNEATYRGNSIDALLGEPGSNPLMCNKLYRRSLLADNGLRFNADLRLGEDNAFQFCTFPCAKVVSFTPEVLYFYRNHKDSAVMAGRDDCDARLLEHIKVVSYVLDTWREHGYLVGHEAAMLNWAIDFLYRDAGRCRLQTRKQLATCLAGLLERCFTARAREDIAAVRKEQLAFILEALDQPVDAPVLSVILCPRDGAAFEEDSFHSLEVQTEQRIELLYVPNPDAAGFDEVRRDDRCRTFDTLAQAAQNVRSPWVVFAGGASEYGQTAFQQLLVAARNYEEWAERQAQPEAQSGPSGKAIAPRADVVTFTDADGSLEHSDVFRYLELNADTNLDGRQTFSAHELGNGVFHFSSAAPYNKMISADLVRAHADGCVDGAAGLALTCLTHAEAILPTQMPLLTLHKPLFQPEGGVEALVASCMRPVEHANLDERARESLRSAVAAALCSLADSMRDPTDAALLFCATRKALDGCPAVQDDALLPAQNAQSLHLLLEAESSEAYLVTHSYALLHRLGIENGRNLKQVGEIATQAELLRQEIDRFYKSVTYKAGKIVTALPRKIINLLRRKG